MRAMSNSRHRVVCTRAAQGPTFQPEQFKYLPKATGEWDEEETFRKLESTLFAHAKRFRRCERSSSEQSCRTAGPRKWSRLDLDREQSDNSRIDGNVLNYQVCISFSGMGPFRLHSQEPKAASQKAFWGYEWGYRKGINR